MSSGGCHRREPSASHQGQDPWWSASAPLSLFLYLPLVQLFMYRSIAMNCFTFIGYWESFIFIIESGSVRIPILHYADCKYFARKPGPLSDTLQAGACVFPPFQKSLYANTRSIPPVPTYGAMWVVL